MRLHAPRLMPSLIVAAGVFCAGATLAETVAGDARSSTESGGYTESGQASWYGLRHEGRRTTSGERFDSTKMTAAHSSLPMGSLIRVTDSQSGRSIVVRVNDREPPHGVRCIDLSRAAAQQLGIVARGVADVTLAEIDSAGETELAEAPEDAAPNPARHTTARHGRRHTRHAHR